MKAHPWRMAALCVAAVVATASASAQLSVAANGPYYATPSWDQKLTASRFVVLANWSHQAVLDRETGLVWHRSVSQATTLPGASELCAFSETGGRRGWRLPTLPELMSLTEAEGATSILPPGHPFEGVPVLLFVPSFSDFFTATQAVVSPFAGPAYRTVGFAKFTANGNTFMTLSRGLVSPANSSVSGYVMCVRGGAHDGPL